MIRTSTNPIVPVRTGGARHGPRLNLRAGPRAVRVYMRAALRRHLWVVVMAGLLAAWQAVAAFELYPAFIVPPPAAVLERGWEVLRDGTLAVHTATTLVQAVVGLAIGATGGVVLGYALAKSSALDRVFSPLFAALQAVPIVAYAPLLVIWFGTGIESKIVTCALTVFFPMLTNTFVGIRSTPTAYYELMRGYSASRWEMFRLLELPAGLPVLFAGLKIAASLAVIGAVIGEWVSADAGLGYLIRLARQGFDTPLVFVAAFMLAVLARGLYWAVSWAEARLVRRETADA
jgi:NitT/TauT family transport system permease protein